MAALLCINAASSLPTPWRRTSTYSVALTAPIPARRRGLPSRGLRCTSTEVSVPEKPDVVASAVKEAVVVPLPPFEQSLAAVGSVSDEAAAKKISRVGSLHYVISLAEFHLEPRRVGLQGVVYLSDVWHRCFHCWVDFVCCCFSN